MAQTTSLSDSEKNRAQHLAAADAAAYHAVLRNSSLRGGAARKAARAAVNAAAPNIRTEHFRELAGVSRNEQMVGGVLALTAIAADIALCVAVARRGPRWARLVWASTATLHTGVVVYARWRRHQVISAARTGAAKVDA